MKFSAALEQKNDDLVDIFRST